MHHSNVPRDLVPGSCFQFHLLSCAFVLYLMAYWTHPLGYLTDTSKQCHLPLSRLLFLCSSNSKWYQHPLALLSQEPSPSPHPAFLSFLSQVHSGISSSVSRKKNTLICTVSLKLPRWCLKWYWEEIYIIGSTALAVPVHHCFVYLKCLCSSYRSSIFITCSVKPSWISTRPHVLQWWVSALSPHHTPLPHRELFKGSSEYSAEHRVYVCYIYWMNTRTRDSNPSLCSDLPPRQHLESKLQTMLLWILPYFSLNIEWMELLSLCPLKSHLSSSPLHPIEATSWGCSQN